MYKANFVLHVRPGFCTLRIQNMEKPGVTALESKARLIGSLNAVFFFFTTAVLHLLISCICFHLLARCSDLFERNSMLTSLVSFAYCTRELGYRAALLCDLGQKKMPENVQQILHNSLGTSYKVSAPPRSKQQNDEVLESQAVLVIKEGAQTGTEDSIKLAFCTVSESFHVVIRFRVNPPKYIV